MTDSSPDGVDISDGTTSPATTIDEEEDDVGLVKLLYTELKPKWIRLSRRLPISIPKAGLLLFLALTLLIGIAAAIGPFQAFGFLSASVGAVITTLLYHPIGTITPRTKYQKFIYTTVAVSFLLIGIKYMLTGILFRTPFS